MEPDNLADELALRSFFCEEEKGKEEEILDIQAFPSFMSARQTDLQHYSRKSVVMSRDYEKPEVFD